MSYKAYICKSYIIIYAKLANKHTYNIRHHGSTAELQALHINGSSIYRRQS